MDGGRRHGITDAEREAVVASLRRRAALGHIDDAELASRTSRARTAMTHAGLDGLLMDLPPDPDPGAAPPPPSAGTAWADLDAGAATTATRPTSATDPVTVPLGRAAPTMGGPDHRPAPPSAGGLPVPARVTDPRAPVLRASQLTPILVAVVVVAAFAILIVGTIARNGSDDPDPGISRAPSELAPTTATPDTPDTTATPATTIPAPAETVPPAPPPTSPPPPLVPEQQRLVVGVDIGPGRYMQTDRADCFWEIQDAAGNPAAFGAADRPVLDVQSGEVVVLDFCGALVPYAPAAAPATSAGSGDWLVGEDLVAGTYRPSGTEEFCLWERANGFRHLFDEIIEWDDTRRDVTLRDGERFTTDGCGTWSRV